VKIKKTISDKVIAANRRNAQKSTGPKNVAAVRFNAVTHGLLAKRIIFQTEEEERGFQQLLDQFEEDLMPADILQRLLVHEIAVTSWKLEIVLEWELVDMRTRRAASRELLRRFMSKCNDERVSVLSADRAETGNSVSANKIDWDCREVVLKAGNKNGDVLADELGETGGGSVMELRLTSPLETILRYQGSLKRDLYRAIQMLQSLKNGQEDRSTPQTKKKPPRGTNADSLALLAKESH
jgi:hypothetical protein